MATFPTTHDDNNSSSNNNKTPLEIWKKRNYSSISDDSSSNNFSSSPFLQKKEEAAAGEKKNNNIFVAFNTKVFQDCFGRNNNNNNQRRRHCYYYCKHRRRNRILSILLITLILSIVSCYFLQKAAIFRKDNKDFKSNNNGGGVLPPPPKTTPTLLSIVDPITNYYLYAPTNELYEKIYYNGTFYDLMNLNMNMNNFHNNNNNNASNNNNNKNKNSHLPKLKLDKTQIHTYDSITLSWTTTTTTTTMKATNINTEENINDNDSPTKGVREETIRMAAASDDGYDDQTIHHEVEDSDIIALYCGNKSGSNSLKKQSPYNFLEVATIQQIKATSRKHSAGVGFSSSSNSNEWYIPKFPNLRQEYCHFRLYKVEETPWSSTEKQEGDNELHLIHIATSDILHILDAKSTPTQIHLAIGNNPTKMTIQFTTGDVDEPNTTIPVAKVFRSSMSSTMTDEYKNNDNDSTTLLLYYGETDTYGPENLCGSPANETMAGKFYPPGMLHNVEIDNLEPDTTYTYQVGLFQPTTTTNKNNIDNHQVLTWSDVYSFTTPPIEGDDREVSFIVYGDQGCPYMGWQVGQEWLSTMMSREEEANNVNNNNNHNHVRPAMVHHFGDLSYSMGSAHVWDGWMEMIQPFAPTVPLMVAVGNHEYDHISGGENGTDLSGVTTPNGYMPDWGNFENDSNGECGVPTSKRFRMPTSPGSNGVFWYSFGYASIYTIVLSSEHDLSPASIQYQFLEDTLKDIDRMTFPWVIVELHRPMYEAEGGEHAEKGNTRVAEAIRLRLEDLLLYYQVDVVLAGHYHEYHRTCDGVYKGKCNSGGPIHITIGSAGATLDTDIELDTPWSLKHIGGKFGYGRITIPNATDLHFEFILHGDSTDPRGGQVQDDFWIHRDR